MNAVFVILAALAVAVGGYRWYAGYVDQKILHTDPQKVTPAKMYMDGVDFMPASRNVLFGYQFKSIAGAYGLFLRHPARGPAHCGNYPVLEMV